MLFRSRLETLAKYLAPSLLEPLQTQEGAKAGFSDQKLWQEIFEQPIGRTITQHFMDDVVRGVVLTDALVGTFSSVDDFQANNCFLYHVIGNGSGEWRVPEGGMGALVADLERVAQSAGVEILLGQRVSALHGDSTGIEVVGVDGERYFKSEEHTSELQSH